MAARGRINGALAGLAATFVVAVAAPVVAPALAAGPGAAPLLAAVDPFSELVGDRRAERRARKSAPAVERFNVAADGRIFLLEGGLGEARIKFLCADEDPRLDCRLDPEAPAEEIYLVSGARGPRGDIIYKNREGETLLRLTSYGGATVFWPGERQGQAASRSFGEDGPLLLEPAGRGVAERRGRNATAHISALTGTPIVFEVAGVRLTDTVADAQAAADESLAPGAPVLSDAVMRVAVGMHQVGADPTGARILGSRVKTVDFRIGTGPLLALEGKTLIVVYDPAGGVAGRPSSAAVRRFLEESL